MFNILIIIHIVLAIMLIGIIMIQKSSSDGLSGLSGAGNNGFVNAKTAASIVTKITVILASLFFLNSIVLANLSTIKQTSIIESDKANSSNALPIAK